MDRKEDRLKVQTHLNVNMVVEAGAGTGKTTLLIRRTARAGGKIGGANVYGKSRGGN